MLLKVTKKVLLDRNTVYNPFVHHIHGYWYCLLFLLLFIEHTILFTDMLYVIVTVSFQYSSNMDIDCFNWIKY